MLLVCLLRAVVKKMQMVVGAEKGISEAVRRPQLHHGPGGQTAPSSHDQLLSFLAMLEQSLLGAVHTCSASALRDAAASTRIQ